MTTSSYIDGLRSKIGDDLLLLPSIAALIHDDYGRLLLQRKSGTEGWSLPAGGIEPGETPLEALHREVREETGGVIAKAEVAAVLGGEAFRYRYPNGHLVEYTVVVFRCTMKLSKLAPIDPETQELRFFSKADIPALAQPYPKSLLF
jgi:8-oxo-dGTP pyrophosphatase MutT (NUDIX family)